MKEEGKKGSQDDKRDGERKSRDKGRKLQRVQSVDATRLPPSSDRKRKKQPIHPDNLQSCIGPPPKDTPKRRSKSNEKKMSEGKGGDTPKRGSDTMTTYRSPSKESKALYSFSAVPAEEWIQTYAKRDNPHLYLSQEFRKVCEQVPNSLSTSAAAQNPSKNRYQDIVAWDQTRVQLKNRGMGETDYINASFVDSYLQPKGYILTQAPKVGTVNDFWDMVWQERCAMIVMLCQLEENGKEKSQPYWSPLIGETFEARDYTVLTIRGGLLKEDLFGVGIIHCTLKVTKKKSNDPPRKINHIIVKTWPDHHVPDQPELVTNVWKAIRVVEKMQEESSNLPVIVHCSAGIGRSGTFVAIEICIDALRSRGKINVPSIIERIREQRKGSIQNAKQYMFVYASIFKYFKDHGKLDIPLDTFMDKILAYAPPAPGASPPSPVAASPGASPSSAPPRTVPDYSTPELTVPETEDPHSPDVSPPLVRAPLGFENYVADESGGEKQEEKIEMNTSSARQTAVRVEAAPPAPDPEPVSAPARTWAFPVPPASRPEAIPPQPEPSKQPSAPNPPPSTMSLYKTDTFAFTFKQPTNNMFMKK